MAVGSVEDRLSVPLSPGSESARPSTRGGVMRTIVQVETKAVALSLPEASTQSMDQPATSAATKQDSIRIRIRSAVTGNPLVEVQTPFASTVHELKMQVAQAAGLRYCPKLLLGTCMLSGDDELNGLGIQDGVELNAVVNLPAAVLIARLPRVGAGLLDKLIDVVRRVMRVCAADVHIPMDPSTAKTYGFAIVVLAEQALTEQVAQRLDGMVLDRNHTLMARSTCNSTVGLGEFVGLDEDIFWRTVLATTPHTTENKEIPEQKTTDAVSGHVQVLVKGIQVGVDRFARVKGSALPLCSDGDPFDSDYEDELFDAAAQGLISAGTLAVPAVVDLVKHHIAQVRFHAIGILSRIHGVTSMASVVVPTLYKALTDEEWRIRLKAADALQAFEFNAVHVDHIATMFSDVLKEWTGRQSEDLSICHIILQKLCLVLRRIAVGTPGENASPSSVQILTALLTELLNDSLTAIDNGVADALWNHALMAHLVFQALRQIGEPDEGVLLRVLHVKDVCFDKAVAYRLGELRSEAISMLRLRGPMPELLARSDSTALNSDT